jgi:hypothetical protein
MSAFEQAVRTLARSEGHDVADDTPVQVEMTGEWSGYSEYTITNQWDSFTVRCGTFVREYENEEESRHWCPDKDPSVDGDQDCRHFASGPKAALAKLFDDLVSA